MAQPPYPRVATPHLHITLSSIDVIEEGFNGHPLDGNPALEVVNEGISMAPSSVTKVVSYGPRVL